MRYSQKTSRSQLKTDTKRAATLLPRRNLARNLFKINFDCCLRRSETIAATGTARIGQTGSHPGTHAAHKSQLISLQAKQNQGPPALLTLIKRISGHEPTGKGECPPPVPEINDRLLGCKGFCSNPQAWLHEDPYSAGNRA
jgi:hypothetical protein